MDIMFSYVQISGLVVLVYVRNALRHRTGPIRIEKPVRRSSEGDEGRPA